MISRFNGSELELDLKDVEDHIHVPPRYEPQSTTRSESSPTSLLFDAADDESSCSSTEIKTSSARSNSATPLTSEPPDGAEGAIFINDYSATGESRALSLLILFLRLSITCSHIPQPQPRGANPIRTSLHLRKKISPKTITTYHPLTHVYPVAGVHAQRADLRCTRQCLRSLTARIGRFRGTSDVPCAPGSAAS
jgi:hypothetical protein